LNLRGNGNAKPKTNLSCKKNSRLRSMLAIRIVITALQQFDNTINKNHAKPELG
jgi:hypothetical protein